MRAARKRAAIAPIRVDYSRQNPLIHLNPPSCIRGLHTITRDAAPANCAVCTLRSRRNSFSVIAFDASAHSSCVTTRGAGFYFRRFAPIRLATR
jgi:hypothetical protein